MRLSIAYATIAVTFMSGAALAWDNTNTGPGPKSIADGGPSQAQQARGGNAQAIASGGGGGAARSGSRSGSQSGASANYSGSNTATGGSGGRGYGGSAAGGMAAGGSVGVGVDARSAPDVYVPSVGGGGSDCPVVGFGIGGSGIGGGGGFGPSWISSRCDHRRYAMVIAELTGSRERALQYLASVEPDVKEWLSQSAAAAMPVTALSWTPPAWCSRATEAQQAANASCR